MTFDNLSKKYDENDFMLRVRAEIVLKCPSMLKEGELDSVIQHCAMSFGAPESTTQLIKCIEEELRKKGCLIEIKSKP